MQLQNFLAKYGLVAVYAGSCLEGDTVMLVAGGLSHYRFASWIAVWTVGTFGALTADTVCFYLGRSGRRLPRAPRLSFLLRGVDRYGPWEIPLARIVPGARVVSMVFWGARGLPFRTFLVLDLLGCACWAASFAGVGWLLASNIEKILPTLERLEHRLMALVVASAVGVSMLRLALYYWRRGSIPPGPQS